MVIVAAGGLDWSCRGAAGELLGRAGSVGTKGRLQMQERIGALGVHYGQ